MPRKAREKKLFSFYKISQNCQSEQKIFKDDEDRQLLIKALLSSKEKHNFKLLGMCIKPCGYEMILYDNGSDISKIMKSINISFAMHFKQLHETGIVFKERYKSDILRKETVQRALDDLST
jgi:REP element-mobilizing transposase RayT